MTTRFTVFLIILWIPLQAQLPRLYTQADISSRIKVPDSLKKNPYIELISIDADGTQKKGIITSKGKIIVPVMQDSLVWLGEEKGILIGRPLGDSWVFGLRNLKGESLLPENFETIQYAKFLILTKSTGVYQLYDHTGMLINTPSCDTAIVLKNGDVALFNNMSGTIFRKTSAPVFSEIKNIREDSNSVVLVQYPLWKIDSSFTSFIYADSISFLNDSLVKVKRNNKWALYSNSAELIMPYWYDSLSLYKERYIKGLIRKQEGIWSLSGEPLLAASDSIWMDDKGYFHLLKRTSGWKVCNNKGRFVNDTAFAETGIVSNALLAVKRDSAWGFLHESGKWMIPPKYKAVTDFRYGYSLVECFPGQKYHYALIDRNDSISLYNQEAVMYFYGMSRYRFCTDSIRKGEPQRELYYPFPPYRYEDIRPWIPGFFTTHNGNLKGVLDARGKEIIYCHQDTIFPPTPQDSVFLYKRKNGSIGVSDVYGNRNLYTNFRFQNVQTFKDGLARFKENGLYGFFDRYGNVIVSPQYTTIKEYSGGHVAVVLKNKWGYLDTDEKLKIQPYYAEVLPVKNGLAIVRQSKKWDFLNTDGKKINVTSYDKFIPLSSGKYLVFKGKKAGLTNPQGREIVFPKYDAIYELSDSTFAVRRDGYYGVLDHHENILINFQYAGIVYDKFNKRYYLKSDSNIIPVPNEVP